MRIYWQYSKIRVQSIILDHPSTIQNVQQVKTKLLSRQPWLSVTMATPFWIHTTREHTHVYNVSACVLLLVCVIMATPSWTCAWCALVSVCDEPCLYLRVKTVTHATNCFTCVIIVYSVVLPFLMMRVKILSFYLFLTNFKTEVLNSIVF